MKRRFHIPEAVCFVGMKKSDDTDQVSRLSVESEVFWENGKKTFGKMGQELFFFVNNFFYDFLHQSRERIVFKIFRSCKKTVKAFG